MAINHGISPFYALDFGGKMWAPFRCFIWDADRLPAAPSDGARVDGVSDATGAQAFLAGNGMIAKVEASASITAADALEVGTDGRVETQSAGVTIGRALEAASGGGDVIWCVFETFV